jgi:hypothetical protein
MGRSKQDGSKSKLPIADPICRKTDSSVSKTSKSEKICDKIMAPGCRIQRITDYKVKSKEMSPCRRKLESKTPFSEFLNQHPSKYHYRKCAETPVCPAEKWQSHVMFVIPQQKIKS